MKHQLPLIVEKKIERKDSITLVKNEPSIQGLTTVVMLVLKLNYRCNTFARDIGINFSQTMQEW